MGVYLIIWELCIQKVFIKSLFSFLKQRKAEQTIETNKRVSDGWNLKNQIKKLKSVSQCSKNSSFIVKNFAFVFVLVRNINTQYKSYTNNIDEHQFRFLFPRNTKTIDFFFLLKQIEQAFFWLDKDKSVKELVKTKVRIENSQYKQNIVAHPNTYQKCSVYPERNEWLKTR